MKKSPSLLLRRSVTLILFLFAVTCLLSSPVLGKNILGGLFGKKKKNKEQKETKTADAKTSTATPKKMAVQKDTSHRFFSFEEAPYFTSPDKRIGAKLLIDSTKVGPTLAAMQHLTYLPGAHVTSHRHVYVTEVIYVVKGNLTLRIDKEVKVMGPDSSAYIPPQTFHEYMNDSQDICQFLQFYSPSGPEEEYRSWEVPGEEKAAIKPIASGPEVVNAPPVPLVPGSPMPVLGKVKEVNDPAGADANKKEFNLELKRTDAPAPGPTPAPVPTPTPTVTEKVAKPAPAAKPEPQPATAKKETKASGVKFIGAETKKATN